MLKSRRFLFFKTKKINLEQEITSLSQMLLLDSNGCGFATDGSVAQGVKRDAGFDVSQLNWMESVHSAIKEKYGAMPSFACFHIRPLDFMEIFEKHGWLRCDDYLHRERFKPYKIERSDVEFGGLGEAF